MTKLFLPILLTVLNVQSPHTSENAMLISGTIKNVRDGTIVYLIFSSFENTPVDSAVIANEQFEFRKLTLSIPSEAILVIGNANAYRQPEKSRVFFAENAKLHFTGEGGDMQNGKVAGGHLNKSYDKYNNTVQFYERVLLPKFRSQLDEASGSKNVTNAKVRIDSVTSLILKEKIEYAETSGNFYKGFELLKELASTRAITPEKALEILSHYDENLRKSATGLAVEDLLRNIKNVAVGKKLPGLRGIDVVSNLTVDTENFSGKVLMINFWASTCGPCRAGHKEFARLYQTYHSKGFEIIGFSLDQNKTKLTNAIKTDKIIWPNISDLNGWKSSVVKAFAIASLPTTILTDEKGNVVLIKTTNDIITLEQELERLFHEKR